LIYQLINVNYIQQLRIKENKESTGFRREEREDGSEIM